MFVLTVYSEGEIGASAGNGEHAEQHRHDGDAKQLVHFEDGGKNGDNVVNKDGITKLLLLLLLLRIE